MEWLGKKDSELEILYDTYAEKFGFWPDGYLEMFPGDIPIDEWKRSIKKAIDEGIEMPDIYPELCEDT